MIYASRTEPGHWHIVLFRWKIPGGAELRTNGAPLPFDPGGRP